MGVMTVDGTSYPITEILVADKDADAVLARIAIPEGAPPLQPIPLAANVPVGSPISVLSHPTNRFYTYTEGIISRYALHRTKPKANPAPRMTVTADFAKGSSGAPVFDRAGNVCGMVSSTNSIYYNKDEHGNQQNLQMVVRGCVPAASVLKLVSPAPE